MTERERIARRAVAALNEEDWQEFEDCIHPDMRLSQPVPDVGQTEYANYVGTYHGREEAVAILRRFAEEAKEVQVEFRHIETVGDDGLLYEFVWLIGPEASRSAQLAWGLSRFKDDRVLSSSIFTSEDAARAAIARGA
jgi:limonene-1,2-epoxide hydrolase